MTELTTLPFTTWPKVLPKTKDDPVLAFAVGLHDDLMLMLDEAHWPALKKALGRYCSSAAYWRALAADGSQRHDVDGRAVGPVDPTDRLAASVLLLAREVHFAKTDAGKAAVLTKVEAVVEQAMPTRIAPSGRKVITLKRAS